MRLLLFILLFVSTTTHAQFHAGLYYLPCSVAAITGTLTVNETSTTQLSNATAGGTWSSSTTAVATIGTAGLVTGVSQGTSTITYSIGSGCEATAVVTVTPFVPAYSGFVTATAGATGATTSSVTMNTAGKELIVVQVSSLGTGVTLADNQGNTYTAVSATNNGNCVYHLMFYVINPTTNATHTITATAATVGCSGVNGQASITVIAADCTGTPIFSQALAIQTSPTALSTLTSSTITPSTNNEALFYGVNTGGGTASCLASYVSVDASNGTANTPGVNKGSTLAVRNVSSTTPTSITANASCGGVPNGIYTGQIIAFR
jgi:hypothetical protein